MVGDLKYGRTVHSLLMAMSHFNPTFHFVAPDELKMPIEYKIFCEQHHIPYFEHSEFSEEVINQADILYMTRVQRERFYRPHGVREGKERIHLAQQHARAQQRQPAGSAPADPVSTKSHTTSTATPRLTISNRPEQHAI